MEKIIHFVGFFSRSGSDKVMPIRADLDPDRQALNADPDPDPDPAK